MRVLLSAGALALAFAAPSLAQQNYGECVTSCYEASCNPHYEMSSPDWLMCVDRCMMICEPLTWPGNVAALNDSLGLRDDEMMTRVSFVAPVELSAQENA